MDRARGKLSGGRLKKKFRTILAESVDIFMIDCVLYYIHLYT